MVDRELSQPCFVHLSMVNFPGAMAYRKAGTHPQPAVALPLIPISMPAVHPPPTTRTTVQAPSAPRVTRAPATRPYVASPVIAAPETMDDAARAIAISIRDLANQGRLTEALALCDDALSADKLAAGLYTLRATILQELPQQLT